jgi:hypothetical protein
MHQQRERQSHDAIVPTRSAVLSIVQGSDSSNAIVLSGLAGIVREPVSAHHEWLQ